MKIVVTGTNGQLGYDVVRELVRRNITSDITETNTRTNTRTNTKDESSVVSRILPIKTTVDIPYGHQSSGARYEIIATDVVLPDFDESCSIMSEPNCESQTTNRKKLTFVSLDITDKEAVHRLICGDSVHNKSVDSQLQLSANSYQQNCNDTGSCIFVQEDDTKPNESASEPVRQMDKVDCVIHCSAYTAVDAAEDNIELCRAVNVEGTRNIAEACKELGAKMIYISTDYVFSGEGTEPWKADCRDFAPQNVYGRSKLDGEFAVTENLEKFFIVRIAWAFGNHGNNFVKTMLKVGATHDEVRVVNDQIGTPTYTRDLAKLLCDMAESDKYGYYHATNEGGFISWYDFTCEIYRQAGYNTKVTPVSTAEYGLSRAKRPFNSRLDKSKLEENGFEKLPNWQDALRRYLKGDI